MSFLWPLGRKETKPPRFALVLLLQYFGLPPSGVRTQFQLGYAVIPFVREGTPGSAVDPWICLGENLSLANQEMMYDQFMQRAIALAIENAKSGSGGPFAAVVVKDGRIIAEGTNRVTSANDPSAHAEIVAIRET